MKREGADFTRLKRRIRLVCLGFVPIVACITTALALWSDYRAGRPFEPHPIFSGLGLIGWGFAVFVLSGPALTAAERIRADWRNRRRRK
ncbi:MULTISPECIES: hypothetical protein [Novosphingobium]|uniref:Uncharacterized protein n=1 Tax=Novosphingobium decolorationis TaxID=2698673 RepID=A0ABX8E7U8_9SPHN|nr:MULTISPECIES: hypothetical protein [Novosphingobium]MED5543938.1 hypothetical protein [Pseudomonadota bacterium]QVM84290.1 hypothetical protein HT578_11840 [Novosphingobium decolorationis]GAM04784.1 hypothetical protein MBENS4_1782 [Novosphingobium sp. MBES04]